jgi:hypothetical protein
MAASTLAILPRRKGQFGDLIIQATLEETHHAAVEVTDHPVQASANITDHSYNRPAEVTIRCGWSNAGVSDVGDSKPMNSGTPAQGDYVTAIFSKLTALKEARVPLTIMTSLMNYTSMLITAIQVTRDEKTYQALMCSVSCKEVILVDTITETVDPVFQPVAQTTAAVINTGTTTTAAADPQVIPGSIQVANDGTTYQVFDPQFDSTFSR